MKGSGAAWVAGVFVILVVVLFGAAYYMQSYGLGLLGAACVIIAVLALVKRGEGG
jgi:hypothetical protein